MQVSIRRVERWSVLGEDLKSNDCVAAASVELDHPHISLRLDGEPNDAAITHPESEGLSARKLDPDRLLISRDCESVETLCHSVHRCIVRRQRFDANAQRGRPSHAPGRKPPYRCVVEDSSALSVDARMELWKKGLRWYEPASIDEHLDCEHLQSVESQLARVVGLISALIDPEAAGVIYPEFAAAWDLGEQWLRLASGLSYVDVDRASFDPPYMCGPAMDYEAAANRAISLFITEYTRLLYTWNAVEVLLPAMRLPEVPEARGLFNSAAKRLTQHWSTDVPDHYDFLLAHLVEHVRRDPWLAEDKRMAGSLDVRPWRGRVALLFSSSQQLRHVLAHGALRMPEPDFWGEEMIPDTEPIALSRLHLPRIGTRGLALGLQLLVASLVAKDLRLPIELLPSWVEEMTEESDPLVRELLSNSHIKGPR